MKNDYIVTRHTVEKTEEEKEEIYKDIAAIFVRMAQNEKQKSKN